MFKNPWIKHWKDYILNSQLLPYGLVLAWVIPLLFLRSSEQSLLAHDEGLYANYARLMLDSGDWIHPWKDPHNKPPGLYWLVAISMNFFGVNEPAARLPSVIASLINALLFYQIGRILLNARAALLATFCLWGSFLWLQYNRLVMADPIFLCCIFVGILGLLKAEQAVMESDQGAREKWLFLTGLSFGLGFLFRGLMLALPIFALLPYLIANHRRHHHLTCFSLYLGFAIGLLPTLIWIGLCTSRFGLENVSRMLGFVGRLSSNQRHGHSIFYYCWNLPLNAFPWIIFGLLGVGRALKDKQFIRYRWILVGCPIASFIFISNFSTRLPHYGLLTNSFLALLAGVFLDQLCQPFQSFPRSQQRYIYTGNILLLICGFILIFAGLAVNFNWIGLDPQAQGLVGKYGRIAVALGFGWFLGSALWLFNRENRSQNYFIPVWIVGLLMASWLALTTANVTGLLGNANPQVKKFVQQPQVQQILDTEVVHFASLDGKMGVLLRFYTPHIGLKVDKLSELPSKGYVWIEVEQLYLFDDLKIPYQVIGEIRDWYLIKYSPRLDLSR